VSAATDAVGRFGFHPDPAIDFCEEVGDILARHHSIALGNEADDPTLDKRIFTASMFRVGGDQGAVGAKMVLRRIEAERVRGFGKVKSWECWPFGEPCEWPKWYADKIEAERPKLEAALAKARGEP